MIRGVVASGYRRATAVTKQIILTSGTSWTVPSDWNSANNTVECIGAGADGAAGGGGGGAWTRKSNIVMTPGAVVSYHVGTPSTTQSTTNTWLGSTTTVKAVGAIDSLGAPASACVGDVAFSGGDLPFGGSGGGGAAGSNGDGVNAQPGSSGHGGAGGAGDAGYGGAGGAGAIYGGANGGDGGPGTEWGTFGGSGGGGGGAEIAPSIAGDGGLFGGGGGSGSGKGAPGAIFITYTTA